MNIMVTSQRLSVWCRLVMTCVYEQFFFFERGLKIQKFCLKNELENEGLGAALSIQLLLDMGLRMVLIPWCRRANVELSTAK